LPGPPGSEYSKTAGTALKGIIQQAQPRPCSSQVSRIFRKNQPSFGMVVVKESFVGRSQLDKIFRREPREYQRYSKQTLERMETIRNYEDELTTTLI
jgi:hypothetical protein